MQEKITLENLTTEHTLVGSDGSTVVNAIYETHIPERMYEIELENGEKIKCSGNHLWYAETDNDRANKEHYKELALKFFADDPYLEKLENDILMDLEGIVSTLGTTSYHKEYLMLVCDSLGPVSVETVQEYLDMNFNLDPSITNINLYSINDIFLFIQKMRDSLVNNKGYFYFGKVYTTDVLFSGYEHGEINIPTINELRGELA